MEENGSMPQVESPYQVFPPLLVLMTTPFPMAYPVFASRKCASTSSRKVRVACFFQVAPPSVVFKMVPESPSAKAVEESKAYIPYSQPVIPEFRGTQLRPPSAVVRMRPL